MNYVQCCMINTSEWSYSVPVHVVREKIQDLYCHFVSAVGELFCEESVLEDDSVQDLQVLHMITIY